MRHSVPVHSPAVVVAALALLAVAAIPRTAAAQDSIPSAPGDPAFTADARAGAGRGRPGWTPGRPEPMESPARAIAAKRDSSSAAATRLGRAAREWRVGNLRAVIENLEALDFASPAFAEADRAAFLLGQAYLQLGQRAHFDALARAVSAWKRPSVYADWMEFELAWRGGEAADSLSLSGVDTSTALGRDLAGVVLIGRATRALERGADAEELLAAVPAGSRYAGTARHLRGQLAIERGDPARAFQILSALVREDTAYAARREAWLALAGLSIAGSDWSAAHQAYDGIDRDWRGQRDRIAGLLREPDLEALWRAWESSVSAGDAWRLDTGEALAGARRLAEASTDLRGRPERAFPGLGAWQPGSAVPPAPAPDADAWREVEASAVKLEEATAGHARTRWDLAREREALDSRRHYLGHGLTEVAEAEADLAARVARLDSLRSAVEALVLQLRSVRDESTRRVLRRSAEVIASCERSIRWMRAMVHFHLSGPERGRSRPMPPGFPSRDVLLAEEEALTRAILALAEDLAARAPGLIARSHDEAWGPRLVDRMLAQREEARSSLAWARVLGTTVDSARAAAATSDSLRAREARALGLERAVALQGREHRALRDRVARASLERTLAALGREREAIEYGLAVSAYGLAVRLTPAAEGGAPVVTAKPASHAGHDSGGPAGLTEESETDPASARWRAQAIARHQSFLTRHPRSFARGEMRFRLADLMLVDARQQFREQMAAYLKAQSEGRSAGLRLPVLSHAPALALYRKLLAEDPDFAHRDAALFNAAMILAEGASPEAMRLFGELVTRHPGSRYAQESHLRMGDLDFDARRFPDAATRYAHASRGPDPNLQVIALYKLGWAHFNQDRFTESADAFRAVLDLYASPSRARIQADLSREAETYLVHSLAGAGGSQAVLAYFDRIGERSYERRVLMSLAQHFRRQGRLAEAAGADQLCLERYPEHAEALVVAQRLIETRLRAGDAAAVRDARLAHAAAFAPGSRWAKAQPSDSLRDAGAAFARGAWETVADEHHRVARARGSRDDWRQALALYQAVLSHWPDGDGGAHLRMRAGEASTALGEHAAALRHYQLAASTGSDSVAADALWQRVAVTDAWYGTTRPAGGRSAPGSDSLAREVRNAADALLERFPDHRQGAPLAWRRGQLAYAHGWYADAARDFEQLTKRYPADARVPDAAVLRADALYRMEDFGGAGPAWEEALGFATAAGRDSLARRARTAIPVCAYREAEQAVARDSTDYVKHARLFEKVATRWPSYEHAHAAQYRSGLAYLRAGRTAEGALAMQTLIERFPRSATERDAHLEIARAWEGGKQPARAAEAWVKFAERYPADSSAKDARLKAGDLFAAAGLEPRAEQLRLDFLRRYPGDFEAAMEILEPLARRDLSGVGPDRPVSVLLPAKASKATASPSHLATYLKLAEAHPELASRGVIAQVRFLQGEEAEARCAAIRLSLPLAPAIAARQKWLNEAIAAWKRSVDVGVPEWAHASTFRMGEALVAFGHALEKSERPADLRGEDLLAYEEVLVQQGEVFAGRGEAVWTDLLRQMGREAEDDPWIARAKSSLWQRLGNRFFYRPEVDHPVVEAEAPERRKAETPARARAGRSRRERAADTTGRDRAPAVAQREGTGR